MDDQLILFVKDNRNDEIRQLFTSGFILCNNADKLVISSEKCKEGLPLVLYSIHNGYIDVSWRLLGQKLNPNVTAASRYSPLAAAAFIGHLRLFNKLIKLKANTLVIDANKQTILHYALKNKVNFDIVYKCVKKLGIAVDTVDDKGNTALFIGLQNPNCPVKVIRWLMNNGANWRTTLTANRDNALMLAASRGDELYSIIKRRFLVKHIFDTNQVNNSGMTALMYAAHSKQPADRVINLLLHKAAAAHLTRYDNGLTAIDYAVKTEKPSIIVEKLNSRAMSTLKYQENGKKSTGQLNKAKKKGKQTKQPNHDTLQTNKATKISKHSSSVVESCPPNVSTLPNAPALVGNSKSDNSATASTDHKAKFKEAILTGLTKLIKPPDLTTSTTASTTTSTASSTPRQFSESIPNNSDNNYNDKITNNDHNFNTTTNDNNNNLNQTKVQWNAASELTQLELQREKNEQLRLEAELARIKAPIGPAAGRAAQPQRKVTSCVVCGFGCIIS